MDVAGFDLKKLNLTYKVARYEGIVMEIKLNFTDPYAISPNKIQDRLIVHINQTEPFFVSSTLVKPVDESSRTLNRKLRK